MAKNSSETHLSVRLRGKIEADRIGVEKLMKRELDMLAGNLRLVSTAALNSIVSDLTNGARNMEADLESEISHIRRNLAALANSIRLTTADIDTAIQTSKRRLIRMTLWFPASLAAVTVASSVGACLWIIFLRSTAGQLEREIKNSKEIISQISVAGMSLINTEHGRFLLLPKTAETGWTCGATPCVKMPEN